MVTRKLAAAILLTSVASRSLADARRSCRTPLSETPSFSLRIFPAIELCAPTSA